MECGIPLRGPWGETEFFDLEFAVPGAILTPQLFDDEVWALDSERRISWLYYKGDPARWPENGDVLDAPFERDTTFKLDLLRSDSSILENVMPPTSLQPFWDSAKPDGLPDGLHDFSHNYLANSSCAPNSYGTLSYKWRVPGNLDTKPVYHLQLSTSDSEAIHYSGAFRVGSGCGEIRMGRAFHEKFVLVGMVAVAVFMVGHVVTRWRGRRNGYEAVEQEDVVEEKGMKAIGGNEKEVV